MNSNVNKTIPLHKRSLLLDAINTNVTIVLILFPSTPDFGGVNFMTPGYTIFDFTATPSRFVMVYLLPCKCKLGNMCAPGC